jgi:branched-chain amino acid transport system substrate-binding protein
MTVKLFLSMVLLQLIGAFSLVAVCQSETSTVKITIGVIVPLSGSLSEYGNAVRNAIEMAKQDAPENFKSLIVLYEDSQSDPKLGVSAFKKLTSSPIDSIFVWGASFSEVIAPLAESIRIPLFAMSISPTLAKGKSYVVRTSGTSDTLVLPLVRYIENHKFKKIALIKTEWSYTEELAKALKQGLGASFVFDEYSFSREETDFRSGLVKLHKRNPDIVGVFLGANQVSQFYRQQFQLKTASPSFGTGFFGSQNEIKNSGPNIEGAVFADFSYCKSFTEKYRQSFGTDTHIAYAVNMYDMAILFAQVANTVAKTDKKAFFEEIRKERNYQGVCETFAYKYSKEVGGYFDYPTSLYRIKNGSVVKEDL